MRLATVLGNVVAMFLDGLPVVLVELPQADENTDVGGSPALRWCREESTSGTGAEPNGKHGAREPKQSIPNLPHFSDLRRIGSQRRDRGTWCSPASRHASRCGHDICHRLAEKCMSSEGGVAAIPEQKVVRVRIDEASLHPK